MKHEAGPLGLIWINAAVRRNVKPRFNCLEEDQNKERRKLVHRIMPIMIATLGVYAVASCAPSPPPPSATANLGSSEGTVTFSGGAFAVGIGFQWGSGILTYQGHQYPFKVNGLSILDVGVSGVSGSGTVHNLHSVADFSGNYVSISAGVTIAGGGSVTSLRNQNGVVIDARATAQGARLTLAPGGVSITLSGG